MVASHHPLKKTGLTLCDESPWAPPTMSQSQGSREDPFPTLNIEPESPVK